MNLKPAEDFKLMEVKIRDINQVSMEAWEIKLFNEETSKIINIIVDIGQVTSTLFGMSKTQKLSFSNSIYKLVDDLCKYNNMKIKSIIIDHVDDIVSKSKVELQNKDGFIYFDLSSGDAIALGAILNIPIYIMNNLLQEDEEEDEEIEIEME